MADPTYGFFDPSQMGGYDPYAAYGASPYQAQTKSGQDAIARLLLQQQFDQQNAIAKQQYDQMKSQQDASLQSQRLMAEQQQREGPYSGLARQLSSYGQQMVQTDPMFQAGQFLPKAAGEMFGQDSNPWVKTIATALAGGFGQAMSRSAYQNTMDNEVKPLYQKLFELSRDPQGGQKMLEDPRLAQFASPFVLQQLNDQALQNKTRIEASGDLMRRGMGMNVGPNGAVSVEPVPGFAQINALTQGLEKRATADAQNISELQYGPQIAGLSELAKQQAMGPQRAFETEQGLRKEFQGLPEVKDFSEVRRAYEGALKSFSRNDAASDLDLVYAAAKIFDPGSVVREGEQVIIRNAGGLPGAVQNALGFVSGGQRLDPTLRKGLFEVMGQRYDAQRGAYQEKATGYGRLAGQMGASPNNVVIYPEMPDSATLLSEQQKQIPSTPSAPPPPLPGESKADYIKRLSGG